MRPVLGEAAVTRPHVPELALENTEWMLDLGTHYGDDPVGRLVELIEFAALRRLAHHAPDLSIPAERSFSFSADIALVGPH